MLRDTCRIIIEAWRLVEVPSEGVNIESQVILENEVVFYLKLHFRSEVKMQKQDTNAKHSGSKSVNKHTSPGY